MKLVLLGCWLFTLAANAWAHRLDEYLQATRISVATNRVELSLDLTPGVAVADQVLAVIDKDRDGEVTEDERANYAQKVLKDLQINLDEKVLSVRLSGASFPALFEISSGVGVIRIHAAVTFGQLTAGNHVLNLTNVHLPAISVYLVNALAPKVPAIQITKQTRDESQKEYRLEFVVNPPPPPSGKESANALRSHTPTAPRNPRHDLCPWIRVRALASHFRNFVVGFAGRTT